MYKQVYRHIIQRDIRDIYRKSSPLIKVETALYVDSSYMNKKEVLLYMKEKIKTYL